jgi:hypothetical protein
MFAASWLLMATRAPHSAPQAAERLAHPSTCRKVSRPALDMRSNRPLFAGLANAREPIPA